MKYPAKLIGATTEKSASVEANVVCSLDFQEQVIGFALT